MVKQIDFSTLMASSVHDMKNLVAAVSHAYESLRARMPPELQQSAEVRLIEREAIRLDAMLVQLLGMYKFEHGQLRVQADYCRVDELFEDLQNRHAALLEYGQTALQVELEDAELEGFFDRNLIATVLDNALSNALNHCRETIGLYAGMEDGRLILSICDDGPGYPASMLGPVRQRKASGIDRQRGSTGLGLYFAASIVAMHDQPNREATLELCNSKHLGGACMRIGLPLPSLF